MDGDFQARPGQWPVAIEELLIPTMVGIGVFNHESDRHPALLILHLDGELGTCGEDLVTNVALDTERAVGLLVQIRRGLAEAGVSDQKVDTMKAQALARMEEYGHGKPA